MRMRKYQGGGSTPQGDPDTIQKLIDAAKSSAPDLLKTLFKANILPLNVVDTVLRSMGGEEDGESTMRGTETVHDMISSRKLPEYKPESERSASPLILTPRPDEAPEYMEPIGAQEIPSNVFRVIKGKPADGKQKAAEELMKMLRSQGY